MLVEVLTVPNDYYIEAYAASDPLIKNQTNMERQKGGNPDENVSNLTATIPRATAITDVIGTAPGVQAVPVLLYNHFID